MKVLMKMRLCWILECKAEFALKDLGFVSHVNSFFARLSRLVFYTVAPRSQMHCKEGKQIAKCCKSSQNATEEFLGR